MKQIGPHRLTNGSLTDPQVDSLFEGRHATVFYSDPPWGDGNLEYWATLCERHTGTHPDQVSHKELTDRILELIDRHVAGHIFLEVGLRWKQAWLDRLAKYQPTAYSVWYRSGSRMLENVLIAGCTHGRPVTLIPNRFSGAALSDYCVKQVALPGEVVFDPCCGMGYSARAAVKNGMVFYGNELNASRLAKTEAFLTKAVK